MKTTDIEIRDYNYALPEERIAKFPLARRDASKLLVYDRGRIAERRFAELPELLPPGGLMVFNNTRVIQARLHFRKPTGGAVEIFLLEPERPAEYQESFAQRGECSWHCLVGGAKKWKGGPLQLGNLTAERGGGDVILFRWTDGRAWAEVLDELGELPIPPYLNRGTQESDKVTYQTVYGKVEGSVAAPTAGLHFTPQVLAQLDAKGIAREEVTLHVGAGTFKPVKANTIGGHEMHTEHISVRRRTVERLVQHGGRATAVGTTSVRTLESLYFMGLRARALMDGGQDTGDAMELATRQWEPYADLPDVDTLAALRALLLYMERHGLDTLVSATQIIIAPGYRYRVVERMVTNFHQPQSTLLLLVSAFVGGDWRAIYDHAMAHGFRFLSYGDSSLLIP